MGMAHLLVHWGIFKKVKISFLPVGHTHDDVDQMFSCFSTPLKRAEIFELKDIEDVCKANYSPTPQFFHLEHMASWATHLAPYLPKVVQGITKPRCFLVKRDAKGVVRHKFRNQLQTSKKDAHSTDCWMPVNGLGYRMFDDFKGFPDPSTVVRVPTKAADMDALRGTLEKTQDYMSASQISWWNEVIAKFKDEDDNACQDCTLLREEMKKNSVVKKDQGESRTLKQRAYSKAYKAMYIHLGDPDTLHLHAPFFNNEDSPLVNIGSHDFGSSVGNLLRVKTPFQWINGAWSHIEEVQIVLSGEEALLVRKLYDEQKEGVPSHVVSTVNKEKDRDSARHKENPEYEFNPNDWCVLRQDLTEEPFFVGRIVMFETDEENVCSRILVHECGSEEGKGEKKKCLKDSVYKLRWQKVSDVNVKLNGKKVLKTVTVDQFTTGNKKGEAGFKMVTKWFDPASVVEWGKKAKIVTAKGTLLIGIQKAISANPLVAWTFPEDVQNPRFGSSSSSSSSRSLGNVD
jgi:hypothetical protein